jgi:hypothetical protein
VFGECPATADTQCVSSLPREGQSRPRWFVLVRLWTTAPIIVIAVAVGYAVGHVAIGAVVALAYVVGGFGLSRWARAKRARVRERLTQDPEYRRRYQERSDRLARIFGWYFAGVGALVVLAVVAWVIAKLA